MGKSEMDQAGEDGLADQGRLDVGQGIADRHGAAKGDNRHVLLRGNESMEFRALKRAHRIAQGKGLRPIARPAVGCQAAMSQVVPSPQTETDRSGVTVDDCHRDCSFGTRALKCDAGAMVDGHGRRRFPFWGGVYQIPTGRPRPIDLVTNGVLVYSPPTSGLLKKCAGMSAIIKEDRRIVRFTTTATVGRIAMP